jgi:hypothetical protein
MNPLGANFIARPYRGVSVQEVSTLDPSALLDHIRSRRVYKRTEFLVAVCGERRALVQVERDEGHEVLVPVRDARLLAGPDDVTFVSDPGIDTANASQLARVARSRATIVEGKFGHVNFILDPAPLRVRVVEVVPPEPPKLLEMARAVLDYDEDLPPVELDYEPIDLRALAAAHPAERHMFPCRCSGLDGDFLDAGPPEAADWTLVGCERSREIHVALYGREPSARVDFCPRGTDDRDGPTLMKCCLLERGIERDGARWIVPWGASLEEVRGALRGLAGVAP